METLRKLSLGLRRGGNNNTETSNNEEDVASSRNNKSFRSGMGSSFRSLVTTEEPKFDFRPRSQGKTSATTTVTQQVDTDKKRNETGGGALVGEVAWIPDPANQGYRAVVKPNRKSDTFSPPSSTSRETSSPPDITTTTTATPKGRPVPAFSEDNVAPTQDALTAKRVIEEAIEAERAALERVKNQR